MFYWPLVFSRELTLHVLGCHMSIAGGYDKAVVAAAQVGCDCLQIFTKNNNRWLAKPISPEQASQFRSALHEHGISHPLSHASYLINLASPKPDLRDKSIQAMVIELQRAELLGIPYVVMHPGSFTTSDQPTGIQNICNSIDKIHQLVPDCGSQILLENTAGQGSNLGWQFEQLAAMLNGIHFSDRVGVCIDTCHAFAAGYSLSTESAYHRTFDDFDQLIGIHRIKAFHLNDSKKPFGSRKDRHEHIGQGEIGLSAFRFLLNDNRFANVPMYLETAKGEHDGRDLDVVNLETLRNLVE